MMKKILLILLAGVMLVSCGKKEVKQASPESKTGMEAFALAETIKNAFVVKDKITLRKNSTEEGYKDITANTRTYDSVELTFTPRWVEIENNKVHVNIAWKSAWVISGKKVEERGMAVFAMEGAPLKVSGILRANPFICPEKY
ncbi:MAG: hypothetical protein EHM54_10510 [Nitrospiraceae bacterium]|nr:MAG: hypothetical protein EHM54_10510 [Nitrospiraceae bacterium]